MLQRDRSLHDRGGSDLRGANHDLLDGGGMMTPAEFQYIKRAMEVFESQELSLEDQRKVLQTISEITAKAAVKTQEKLVDRLVA